MAQPTENGLSFPSPLAKSKATGNRSKPKTYEYSFSSYQILRQLTGTRGIPERRPDSR